MKTNTWAPSLWGRTLTASSDWSLSLQGAELSLTVEGQSYQINVEDEILYRVKRGIFWTDITFNPGRSGEVTVDGLPNIQGSILVRALDLVLIEKRTREDVEFLQSAQRIMSNWRRQKLDMEEYCRLQRRWFTHEMQASLMDARPEVDVTAIRMRLELPNVRAKLGKESEVLEECLVLWGADHRAYWQALNNAHSDRELKDCKDLFDRVESKPLTVEQARAVVCFDNRVQVVASAGSGKTSIMVAKAAYAIHRGFIPPERIILLAFNKQAAEELKERASKSFKRLGIESVAVEASTFHALGLSIIGKATRKKPDIPDWATDTSQGFRKLTELVDQLKDHSATFRAQWDLFRFVFGRDLPPLGTTAADTWDVQGNGRVRTSNGELVRSYEEAMIANWLFLNGVEYRYEQPYEHQTANEHYRQYRPDFYYPSLKLYHEHFALNAEGEAPVEFKDYLEGVAWKRQLHQEHGTSLFETTSHGLRNGVDFQRLSTELTRRGIVLDPNPDRPIPEDGQRAMEPEELTGLVRTFISHAKSNCLTVPMLRERLDAMPEDTFKHRHRMFLDIAEPLLKAWDAALAAEGGIDFEDMLNIAAEHLEAGRYEAPYELVMADEFQDASRARARLCRALVQKSERYFFAVGDDWQSINRFAGADVSVMTGFKEWFGQGQILKLEQTFRCPQQLCDVSSCFVSRNPAQIRKQVRSVTPAVGPVLQAFQVDHKTKLSDAISQLVVQLAHGVSDGSIPPGQDGKVSVFVLGRYNADRQYIPTNKASFERWVDVSFLTIHRSKGSEADYVILPEMLSLIRGRSFPNTRSDDPVLALAMPASEDYPFGEERRLFYVALTRARRSVSMFTARGQVSSFLRELEINGVLSITDTDGQAVREESCPACKQGVLVVRTGRYGEFQSCSNFPVCKFKPRKRVEALRS